MENNYDKFAKIRQRELQEGKKLAHSCVEKPMMEDMIPDITDCKVLMIGCGTGEESALLSNFGATDLTGIDLSKNSIDIAKNTFPQYVFLVGNMSELPFPNDSFDFIYSSLAIHYTSNPQKVFQEVFRILKKDGQFLFSVGHPMRWSSTTVIIDDRETKVIGFTQNEKDETKVYGNYLSFKSHEHFFPNGEILNFYTGCPSMYFKLLKKVGFSIEDFTESKCIEKTKDIDGRYFEIFSEIPQFMAFLAKK